MNTRVGRASCQPGVSDLYVKQLLSELHEAWYWNSQFGTINFSDIRPPAHTQYMYNTNIVEKVM